MSDDASADGQPTRREYVKYGGTVVGGGLLAGCTGDGGSESTATPDSTATDSPTAATETATGDDGAYSVTMSPMGTVEFDAVPETVMGFYPWYADMAIAVGHGDALTSLYAPEMFGGGMNNYYHHLDGVSLDWEELTDPNPGNGTDKEIFYELDADVHLIGPVLLASQDGWSSDDVDDVARDLGPVFGNYYSTRRIEPPARADEYEFYTVQEMGEKVAAVFQEQKRYRQIAAVHDELLDQIRSNLPPAEGRPTVARVWHTDGAFDTFRTAERGIWRADIWPLEPRDAFAGKSWDNAIGRMDYEGLLEADPDVLLVMSGTTSYQNVAEIRETLADHSVGKRLSAVQNDRVYASGAAWHQGPIMTAFGLEMTAKQLYPEQFGEWPGYVDGEPLPEIPEDEQLFDRDRLANIATEGSDE
ncbi:ABC-type Fe3+-hydroxamate transport system, substrate-binding protein [Halomicrobium zhouii]|uniref:ABC-type Fe3+-hydroxamate transport system, substrate-binding protein n=1 Tax=Halomicrobium zhouii TaxID=767519 RepID=A0A1I6MAP6_9EURY|nr:ABC transporter substrate-binding protein [Halomicrobium zhouii]SFS12693.1 ABC-type Fe3+-hydroxamate transport system, substrate-binding protein [Halomicrobium zhouii]